MDCCRSTTDKNTQSEALPVAPKNGPVHGVEFTDLAPSHVGLNAVISNRASEFTDYKSPHDPEPLYEKNQDLRL